MQNKLFNLLGSLLIFLTAGILISSCNKKFDAPPSFIEPNIKANITIKDLKTRHATGGLEQITENLIIEGIVVADDKSGNFYKSIAIQDATGGITVRLDATNLYTMYPVGRKIYINMKGLYLGDYNRLIQIGGGIDDSNPAQRELAPIASSLFDAYIVKGSTGNVVTPKVVTIDKLHDSLQSMVIQMDNMEFIESDTSKTYADAVGKLSRSLSVKPCAGSSLIVRTSGFANFAGVNVPNGKGTLLSIYTVFGTTKQLVIRDPSDVKFDGPRCGTGPTTEMNIADLRALYTGTAVAAPDARHIAGVVISDKNAKNINERNLILQQGDGKSGIMVRFADAHTFELGDSIKVNISGQSLEEFNGTLQLNNVPNSFATKVGTGTITARRAKLADINTNFEAWESTLVTIDETVTISGGTSGTWSGTTTFTAGSPTIKSFTATAATFASTAYPAAASSVTGYLGQFNTDKQLLLRNASDVVAGTPPPPPTGIQLTASPLTINFDDLANGLPVGITVRTGATATALGTAATLTTAPTDWNNTSGAFKNFASGDISNDGTAASGVQSGSTDRALGVRTTGSFGDPGAAFVFQLANTTGKTNLKMSFNLQSLDRNGGTLGRTAIWKVQYATGDVPTTFTDATTTGTLTTTLGTYTNNNTITVDFGSTLNNVSEKVWIRVITLSTTTGSGSRPSTALDDVVFTWN